MGELLGTVYGRLLLLLGLVGVAALIAFGFRDDRAAGQVSDLMLLMANARQAFANSPTGYANFSTDNLSALVDAGVVPPSMVKNGKLVDRWGQQMWLGSILEERRSRAQITFGGRESVPDCVKIVSTLKDFDQLVVSALAFNQNSMPNSTFYNTYLVTRFCAVAKPQGAIMTMTFS